jgi:hypothetical protein
MISILIKKGLITDIDTNKNKALDVLKEYWEDKIAIVWQVEDIIDYAKGHKKKVSREKAINILQSMLRRHDCEYGITWETINANL